MQPCKCSNEKQFDNIDKSLTILSKDVLNLEKKIPELDIVYKAVMGNGKEGLITTSVRMEESVIRLIKTTEILRTTISGFTKFQIGVEASIRENQKHKTNKKWYITIIISLMSVIVSIVSVLIIK